MRINSNMAALNAYRNLNTINNTLDKSLERLSSGLRINRAADDAAGLAISEKMVGQVKGLVQAQRNAQDGISMIQTAEGALIEIHSTLQRMRELAVQASNDTLTANDRSEIQKEVDQLNEEITRIADTTEFNTKKLINGALGVKSSTNTDTIEVAATGSNTKSGVYTVDVAQVATQATVGGASNYVADVTSVVVQNDTTIELNGVNIDLAAGDKMDDVIAKINNFSEKTGVTVGINGNGGLQAISHEYGAEAAVTFTADNAVLRNLGMVAPSDVITTTISDSGTDNVGYINGEVVVGEGLNMTLVSDGNDANGLSTTTAVEEKAAVTTEQTTAAVGGTLTVNGVDIDLTGLTTFADQAAEINKFTDVTGVVATDSAAGITYTSVLEGEQASLTVQASAAGVGGLADTTAISAAGSSGLTVGTAATTSSSATFDDSSPSIGDTAATSFKVKGTLADGSEGQEVTIDLTAGLKTLTQVADLVNAQTDVSGVVAKISGAGTNTASISFETVGTGPNAELVLTDTAGDTLTDMNVAAGTYTDGTNGTADGFVTVNKDNVVSLQIGANTGQNLQVGINDMRSDALGVGLEELKVGTQTAANEAIESLSAAIDAVSAERSKLGAVQNRLEHTINNLGVAAENITAAKSRIQDVDMAREMMEFTKKQVLSQAGTAMLAQANQKPQTILQLLR